MLKSTARRRVALKTAAMGALGVGLFAAGGLTGPARADQRTVRYACAPIVAGAPQEARQHDLTVNLAASANVSIGTGFTATFQVVSAGQSPLLAPGDIPLTSKIVIEPRLEVKGNPAPSSLVTVTPSAVHSPTAPIAPQATLPMPPAATATVTPSAGATSIIVTARDFTIKVITADALSPAQDLFRCTLAPDATPAAATVSVGTGVPTGPSTSITPTGDDTTPPTTPTSRITTTYTETVTASPVGADDNGQVTRTPDGGAATGGGGEAGPDGRMFLLAGSLLLLGAGVAGLFLRRRTAARTG